MKTFYRIGHYDTRNMEKITYEVDIDYIQTNKLSTTYESVIFSKQKYYTKKDVGWICIGIGLAYLSSLLIAMLILVR